MSGGHGHTHDASLDHDHRNVNRKTLLISFILITAFMVVEVIGGIVTNSLALLSDAGHMLSDAGALFLSLMAMRLATRPPSDTKTYGYHRFEVLAALLNGITLILISMYIGWEAYQRFKEPATVASVGMMTIAGIGLVVNLVVAWVLMRGDTKHNLNMRSAFLHVLGDLLGSIGAIVAGILMLLFKWYWADPLISVIIALLILGSAWRVTRDSVHVLMEGTPEHISLHRVTASLCRLPEVKEVHDLHIWTVTSGFLALSGHLVIEDESVNTQQLLGEAKHMLKQEYGIVHSTLQLEMGRLCEHGEICDDRGGY